MGLFGGGDGRGMGRVDTIVGPGTSFRGTITSRTTVRVDGEIQGNMVCEDGVIVGEKGSVRGNISAKSVLVCGRVKGDITAGSRIEIASTGRVEGELSTPDLNIENGAVFVGTCHMEENTKVVDMPKARDN